MEENDQKDPAGNLPTNKAMDRTYTLKHHANKLTPHQAAAVAIARRGLGFGERLTTRRLRYTFCLPVRNRRKHVWSDWRGVSRMLERDRKSRSGSRQASNSARGVPLSTAAGPSPAMDGSPGSRGNPSGGSQQHCSAGVCGCSTIFEPF